MKKKTIFHQERDEENEEDSEEANYTYDMKMDYTEEEIILHNYGYKDSNFINEESIYCAGVRQYIR